MKDEVPGLSEASRWPELQRNADACFVCGINNSWGLGASYYTIGDGEVEARVRLGARYQGHPGLIHGGVLAALLDEAMGRAMLARHPGRLMVTACFELRYLLPVPVDSELTIRARVISDRRYLADATCRAELEEGKLAVTGTGTLARPLQPRGAAARR